MPSSRFVSGGTNEAPTERDEAWRIAQANLDAKQAARFEAARNQDSGKSLYETLQANKAAKQEAHEESLKLRHQFQTLDDDDVEFLDSVLDSTRRAEESVRRETAEQLDEFRRQKELAEKNLLESDPTASLSAGVDTGTATGVRVGRPAGEQAGLDSAATKPTAESGSQETWSLNSRKRKKGGEKNFAGVKLRRTSTAEDKVKETQTLEAKTTFLNSGDKSENSSTAASTNTTAGQTTSKPTPNLKLTSGPGVTPEIASSLALGPAQAKSTTQPTTSLLGLSAYSSDED